MYFMAWYCEFDKNRISNYVINMNDVFDGA